MFNLFISFSSFIEFVWIYGYLKKWFYLSFSQCRNTYSASVPLVVTWEIIISVVNLSKSEVNWYLSSPDNARTLDYFKCFITLLVYILLLSYILILCLCNPLRHLILLRYMVDTWIHPQSPCPEFLLPSLISVPLPGLLSFSEACHVEFPLVEVAHADFSVTVILKYQQRNGGSSLTHTWAWRFPGTLSGLLCF